MEYLQGIEIDEEIKGHISMAVVISCLFISLHVEFKLFSKTSSVQIISESFLYTTWKIYFMTSKILY